MTYIVNESCIRCKIMDCVEVCPVDCFYEGENMLVIIEKLADVRQHPFYRRMSAVRAGDDGHEDHATAGTQWLSNHAALDNRLLPSFPRCFPDSFPGKHSAPENAKNP